MEEQQMPTMPAAEPAQQPMAQPVQTMTPPPAATMPSQMTSTVNYASFGSRFLAGLIDFVLIIVVAIIVSAVFSALSEDLTTWSDLLIRLLVALYYVLLTSKYGATVGKMAMKIRVQNINTGANLNLVEAALRELIGKALSGILLIGYLWMLWDPNKQTWHDKIAKSVVVKVS